MRKVTIVTLKNEDARDAGKRFQLTEMPARKGFAWALRAFLSIGKSGVSLPDNAKDLGLAGIARLGLETLFKIDPDDAEPLIDQLLACVMFMPNPDKPEVVRVLIDDDIEEIATRFKLAKEVFKLHVNFFETATTNDSSLEVAE